MVRRWAVGAPLMYLELGGNRKLTGTIAPSLGNLEKLRRLHLHYMALSGTLPGARIEIIKTVGKSESCMVSQTHYATWWS